MPKVRDLMSGEVVALGPEMTLREAIEILTEKSVSGAPVVASGRVVGVLSATDVLEFLTSTPAVPTRKEESPEWGEWGPAEEWEEGLEPPASYYSAMWENAGAEVRERFEQVEGPEWDLMEEHTVGEIMTRSLCALPPEADVAEAARYMLKTGIHRVLVLDKGQLVGIITTTDIVRAVGEKRL